MLLVSAFGQLPYMPIGWLEGIFVCFEFQCVYGLPSEELNIWAYMASLGGGRQGTN